MSNDRFPTGQFAEETRALQSALNAQGYGPVQVDGWFGPATKAALADREQDLAQMPAPPKPWWRTKRAQGAVTAMFGMAALVIPALREIDTVFLVELIWVGLDHADQIITAVGALAALVGTAWSAFGAAKAEAPIDVALLARVGDRELRLPAPRLRLRSDAGGDSGSGGPGDRGPFHDGH